MFRQVNVDLADVDLQRIVWRNDASGPILDYQLTTITYGTACAPYLAIRVLQELAKLEQEELPNGADALLHDSYVDDILSGADSLTEALTRRRELVELLARGRFELSKWSANHPDLLTSASSDAPVLTELPNATKMLGIHWNPHSDEFLFLDRHTDEPVVTKRAVLSRVAHLFDPLGWISPVVIVAKILLQDLWLQGIDWDDPLAPALEARWTDFNAGLQGLKDIRIPRWTKLGSDVTHAELHGFADASSRAYAAVIYLRTVAADGSISTTLLEAKTKAAPVKTVSIPRLELCAAQLLARLVLHVKRAAQFTDLGFTAWSDSTVVLAWLRDHPSRWKTFVANRTTFILAALPATSWRHVKGTDNPADIASRGTRPQNLATLRLWWEGPTWLTLPKIDWPASDSSVLSNPGEEKPIKVSTLHAAAGEAEFNLLQRYSSLNRLVRVTAYCIRFVHLCRRHSTPSSFLTTEELADARTRLLKASQFQCFSEDIESIRSTGMVGRSSRIRDLHPFLDTEDVLRVGGRLENSKLTYNEKHPLILAKSSPLAVLYARWVHISTMHGGVMLTLSLLQSTVWIVRGRSLVKQLLRQCIKCRRHRPRLGQQLIGQLPAARVTPSRPFSHAGVDYAGPIRCRASSGRGQKSFKAYIALFVCLSTKAIHLEPVSSLTTEAFLAAFRRFTARRGVCTELWSDNGTTFAGADSALRDMFSEAANFYRETAECLAN